MKRKIIKQGHNTLTVTLPADWVKRMKLGAGDEMDLSEKGNSLCLSSEKKDEGRRAEIDMSGKDIRTIWKYFMAVYREGYDEVIVKFDPNTIHESPYKYFSDHLFDSRFERVKLSHFELVSEFARRFIGFEVVEQRENYCVLKDLGKISPKEFENSMRRVFFLISQMGEELLEAIEKKDAKIVRNMHDIDVNVDKFHDYTLRVMKKTLCVPEQRIPIIFSTLYFLEVVGDEFKNISKHILKDEKDIDFKNLKELATMAVQQFNDFYDIYYHFSSDKVVKMTKRETTVHAYLPNLYKKIGSKTGLSKTELEIFNHLRRVTRYINSLLELRTQLEYCRE